MGSSMEKNENHEELRKTPADGSETSASPSIANLDTEKEQSASAVDATTESGNEEPEAKMNRKELTVMSFAMALAVFLMALDESIIATAIPKITDRFHSLNDVCWYGSAYLLTMCSFQLHYGKLYTHYSSKTILLIAMGIFELGSLVCATSPSSAALIVGRAIAGSGACGIVSGVLIIISKVVPIRERATYTSAVGSIYGIAAVLGPLLGGVITDSYLTWRWCFYINLPCGAFVAGAILFLYHPRKQASTESLTFAEQLKRMDPLGLVLFMAAIVCLILGLQFSGSSSWSTPKVIALLVLFGVFLLAFAAVQIWLQDRATLPPRIISKRQVICCSLYAMTLDGAYYVIAYYLPIWFQSVKGASAAESGIRVLPLIIGAIISSILGGLFVTKTGYYSPVIFLATILAAVGSGLLSTMNIHSKSNEWIGYQAMFGIGVGLGMQQGAVVVQNGLDKDDIPIAISAVTFFQALGSTLMVSITQNVFDERLYTELVSIIPNITTSQIFNDGATEIVDLLPSDQISVGLGKISLALTQSWYVAVAGASISAFGALGMGYRKFKADEENESADES